VIQYLGEHFDQKDCHNSCDICRDDGEVTTRDVTLEAIKKTLELNPSNAIIKELRQKVSKDKANRSVHNLTYLLFETALLTSGFALTSLHHSLNTFIA
jgi:HSP90 family molecular chaperone